MTSHPSNAEKCGLSSILPMSCRSRAEAFARNLHSRLKSLGTQDDNSATDENSWLAANENSIATAQPRHMLDFCLLESPGSPEEHLETNELHRLINEDSLKPCEECHNNSTPKNPKSNSDSDSDVYYDVDTDTEIDRRLSNGDVKSESSKCHVPVSREDSFSDCTDALLNGDSHIELYKSEAIQTDDLESQINEAIQTESFSTPVDEQVSIASDLSEEVSTLSLREDDCCSEGIDFSKCDDRVNGTCNGEIRECDNVVEKSEETYVSHLSVHKDLTVECVNTQESKIELNIDNENREERESENTSGKDSDDDYDRIPRIRRCSSLKTGKTPPGTPGRKKIVRFADALGLDLADVRTFLDEIPKIPNSAYEDLSVDMTDSSSTLTTKSTVIKPDKILMPLFQQPGGLPNFLDLVRDNLVCLENALVDDPYLLSIKGTVRVRNLDFHKSVYIRYSLNSWKTYADVQASYVDNSCDGFSDKFSFVVYAHTLTVGQRLEFACRFQCKGSQYWDNNNGKNYCFQCLPAMNSPPISPITSATDFGSTASFY